MARGERIVRGIGNQQLHAAVQPAGARAGDEIFQAGITHQHTGDKPHKQENALPAVFFVHRRMSAAKIQIAPPLPSSVIFGIRKSRTGPRSALGMSPSFFTDVLPFSFKNIWGNLLEISIRKAISTGHPSEYFITFSRYSLTLLRCFAST